MSGKPANNDPFRLHPMAEQSLVMVGERLGVTLDAVSCWRWLRELEDLALKMEGAPAAADLCADIDAPFCVGNVQLWLPSPAQMELCARADALADGEKLAVLAFILSRGRSASLLRHLFTVPEADAPNLTPLAVSCDPQAAPADYRKLEAPGPALEKLRPEVRANLAAFSSGGAP